jgi:hypothetical protein
MNYHWKNKRLNKQLVAVLNARIESQPAIQNHQDCNPRYIQHQRKNNDIVSFPSERLEHHTKPVFDNSFERLALNCNLLWVLRFACLQTCTDVCETTTSQTPPVHSNNPLEESNSRQVRQEKDEHGHHHIQEGSMDQPLCVTRACPHSREHLVFIWDFALEDVATIGDRGTVEILKEFDCLCLGE